MADQSLKDFLLLRSTAKDCINSCGTASPAPVSWRHEKKITSRSGHKWSSVDG